MKPTIKMIAEQTGVSTATVSLVLNNRAGVAEEAQRMSQLLTVALFPRFRLPIRNTWQQRVIASARTARR